MALHVRRDLGAGNTEQGGGQVDETNEPVAGAAGLYSGGARCLNFSGTWTMSGTFSPEKYGQRLLRGIPEPWSP